MKSRRRKKPSGKRNSTGAFADQPQADNSITHRFLSSADVAARFPILADAIKSNRERDEARLSEFVTRIKNGARPLNLLNCLSVLQEDHRLHEETAAEATTRQQAMFAEQRVALAQVLAEIAASKKKSAKIAVPPVLKGLVTLPGLRSAVLAHRNEVKESLEANKDRTDYQIDVNWRRCRVYSQAVPEIGEPVVYHLESPRGQGAGLADRQHPRGRYGRQVIEEWVREGRVKSLRPDRGLARLDAKGTFFS